MPDARDLIHAMLVAILAWIGFVLMLPGNTFDSSRSFSYMQGIATEENWALAFALTAVIGVAGMVTQSRLIRFLTVLIVATMHGVFAICLMRGNPTSTGAGTYAIIACSGYYLSWRRAREGLAN